MTITPEDCLRNADDFERWAKQTGNESDRANFLGSELINFFALTIRS